MSAKDVIRKLMDVACEFDIADKPPEGRTAVVSREEAEEIWGWMDRFGLKRPDSNPYGYVGMMAGLHCYIDRIPG